jgi:hypothetical protein
MNPYLTLVAFSVILSVLVGCLISEVRAARKLASRMKHDLTIFHRSHGGRHWLRPSDESRTRGDCP